MQEDSILQRARELQDQQQAQRDLDRVSQQAQQPEIRPVQQRLVNQTRDMRLLKELQGQQLAKQQRDQLRVHQQDAKKLVKQQRDQQRVQQLQQAQQRGI